MMATATLTTSTAGTSSTGTPTSLWSAAELDTLHLGHGTAVAGIAALLIASHPSWSAAEVAEQIRTTAKPALFDTRPEVEGGLGAGVVDFAAAVTE
jgi:hypothetical protein